MSDFSNKISKMKAFRSRKPAAVEQVKNAESVLGVTFADEYKDYLLSYGAASVYGHEFTGITSTSRLSVIAVTLDERALNGMCSELYVVEQTHIDGIVIWQDRKGYVYKTFPGGKPERIYRSLSEYIGN